VVNHNLEHHIVTAAYLSMSVGWVLAPGVALLAGGLPVHLLLRRRSSSQNAAIV